jgi:diketogulonate reductase-like aldo/keto reductase
MKEEEQKLNSYHSSDDCVSRRDAVRLLAATAAAMFLPGSACQARDAAPPSPPGNVGLELLTRRIPSSGESLPIIGLGTWQTFDTGSSRAERQPLEEVLALFVKLGGRVIDSSPMYGRSEAVVGEIATKLKLQESLFLATKVWTTGKEAGIEQMERSLAQLQVKRIDLMQVHNLVDVHTHLATLRDWKQQGRARYIGITHYTSSAYNDVARLLSSEKLDFVQINYSILEREAEERLLPLAEERGVAVIINRPLGGGGLFSRVRDQKLPDWAAEFDCRSWAQFFLKWVVAHPAVTCAIPATSNASHLEDNMQAGAGRLPDARLRQRMRETIAAL